MKNATIIIINNNNNINRSSNRTAYTSLSPFKAQIDIKAMAQWCCKIGKLNKKSENQ